MIDLFGDSVQLLGMPLSSAALFLLAGTLLGHLLWYRDRGKTAVSDSDLEKRYLKVRSSLKQRKAKVRELEKQNASIDEELTNLRQAHSTLCSKNKRLDQLSQSSQEEINQFRHSLNEAQIQLEQEEQRSQTIIDQLQEMIENNAALTSKNQSHQEDFQRLDQQYRQRVSELETAQRKLDTFRTQVQNQQSELEQNQDTINELEQHIANREKSLLETHQTLQQTQRDLVARCEDIDVLHAERDDLKQQAQAQVQTLTRLETDLTLSKQIQAERDKFANELTAATDSLTEQEEQARDLNAQLTDERENRLQLEQFNAACQEQLADLESQLSVETAAFTQSDLALHAAQDANTELQTEISGLNIKLEQSRTKETTFCSKVADLQQLVEQQQQQVTQLCAIREENIFHALDLAETRAQLALETSAGAELREKTGNWKAVQTELETAQQTIREYHERNAISESLLIQNSVHISELSHQAECIPKLELALKQRQTELEHACSEIEQHEATILTAEQICDGTEIELAIAIAEIHALENRILSMSDDISSLSADNALLNTVNQQAAERARNMQVQLEKASISQQQLNECNTELKIVKQEREKLLSTRDDLETTISRLDKQITNHLEEVKQLNERLSQVAIEHEKLEFELQADVEARDTTIAELKIQLTAASQQYDTFLCDLAAKTETLDQRQIEIEELTIQLDEAKIAQDVNIQLTTKIDALEKQLESESEKHEALINDIDLKSNEVANQVREVHRLSSELEDAKSDLRDRDLLKQELTELRSHLGSIREELEDSLDTNAKGQDRIRDMENQLHENVKTIRDLRRKRNASAAVQITENIDKPETNCDQKAA